MLRVSFRLAPPFHHEVSRPPGVEDARCVQPTSATRTTFRVPVLVRSRLSATACTVWMLSGFWDPKSFDRGKGRFTTSSIASANRVPAHFRSLPRFLRLNVFGFGRGRFSSHGARCDQPLTLLSPLLLVSSFGEPSPNRSTLFLFSRGLVTEAAAKITVTTFS